MRENKIRRFNENSELNISDVSENDFILNEMRNILKKKEDDMLWYITEHFTKDEMNRHSENLLRMIQGADGDIADIKIKLLSRNHSR